MDIIRKIIILKKEKIQEKTDIIIKSSKENIKKIIDDNINDNIKIKMLIDDTYIFDVYMQTINLMTIISEKDDYKYWSYADNEFKKYNYYFNTNKKLLECIIKLIKKTNNMYEKIFLSKMGRSMEKFGTNAINTDKICKIFNQLEQTENNIYNIIDKPIKIKIDRKKIDAKSDSIMSSVCPDENNIVLVNKKKYYYLLKKLNDKKISKELELQYLKVYNDILPLVGKLLILRNIYSKYIGYDNYYLFISEKSNDETEEIQELVTDLNNKLDKPYENILKEIQNIKKTNKHIDFIDIINFIDKISPDIKLSPIDILQNVMITIQKKMNIDFRTSKIKALNEYSNCIDIYYNNQLKGHLHIDLLYRINKRVNQITVIKLNNNYGTNLPSVYLLGSYNNLENKICTYSELVTMFKEFGNILINIFAYTPNGISEIDVEIFNFVPDIMEFLAYDDFVLELVCHKLYSNNYKKIIKNMKIIRKLEIIINLKIKCSNVLFDNVVHSSSTFINKLKKAEIEDIKNIILGLINKINNDIFGKYYSILKIDNNYINPSFIYNLINGNQGLTYGSILSYILSYNAYNLIINGNSDDFIYNILENKEYSYRKMILEFMTKLKNDYFDEFITKCLGIEEKDFNYYDEELTQKDI